MANKGDDGGGLEALNCLKQTEPPLFLTPSSDLSFSSRTASEYLFSSLKPYTRKSPFDKLLTNGFDAEQIWQQIDLQSQPLISSLSREIKRFEKDPVQISKSFDALVSKVGSGPQSAEVADIEQDDDSEFDEFEDKDDEEEEEEGDLEESGEDDEMKENEMEEEEESEDDRSEEEKEGDSVFEDKFLKIKELEKYLKQDEEREYGLKKDKKTGSKKTSKKDLDDGEEDDEDDDEEDEDDQLGLYEDGGSDEDEELANARYEDFYVSNNKNSKKTHKKKDVSDDSGAEDEQEDNDVSDDSVAEEEEEEEDNKKDKKLSRHEIEQQKMQAKIAEMEKANMNRKDWTLQGEATAAKRPVNSALEADLDFEHNVRPPPVITEEVTMSIEEIIKKRINEGRFDGVQRAPKLSSNTPREFKELDESKSKKGLADIYEEEYLEKTGLAPASLSFSDELKKEANVLFKQLTFKLNALSHFHFAPKPVIEDMAVETNLPALAMEEVAPMAVSDAAMLAPEEVFAGKGDVKEEAELTQEDRKRRRAKKKRKFKAEQTKRMAKKPKEVPVITQGEGKVAVVKA